MTHQIMGEVAQTMSEAWSLWDRFWADTGVFVPSRAGPHGEGVSLALAVVHSLAQSLGGGSSPGFCCGLRAKVRYVWTVRSSRTVWMCLFSKVEQLQSPFQLFCLQRSLLSRICVPCGVVFSGSSGHSRRHTDDTDRGRDDCQSDKESEYVAMSGSNMEHHPTTKAILHAEFLYNLCTTEPLFWPF